jgi:hypothetical protein
VLAAGHDTTGGVVPSDPRHVLVVVGGLVQNLQIAGTQFLRESRILVQFKSSQETVAKPATALDATMFAITDTRGERRPTRSADLAPWCCLSGRRRFAPFRLSIYRRAWRQCRGANARRDLHSGRILKNPSLTSAGCKGTFRRFARFCALALAISVNI